MATTLMHTPPDVPAGAVRRGRAAMTPALYWLIAAAAALSLAHHLDHVLRGATGIGALTVVLVWLVNRSGSVLIAALAHGTYNMVAATSAAEGVVGTVSTVVFMLAAPGLVVAQLRSGAASGPLAPAHS